LALGALVACSGGSKDPGPLFEEEDRRDMPLAEDAISGVTDDELVDVLYDHWDWMMEESPTWATTLGDHRFDDELAIRSRQAIEHAQDMRREFLNRARGIDLDDLSAADKLTLTLFENELESAITSEVCEFDKWSVSSGNNPIARFNYLPNRHKLATAKDGANLIARYRKIPIAVDHALDSLTRGVAAKMYVSAETLRRTVEMIDTQLAESIDDWPLLAPARDKPDGWSAADHSAFAGELRTIVKDEILPAYKTYRAYLAGVIGPKARGPKDDIGLLGLPGGQGEKCYDARIAHYTGLDLTAQELHDLGLQEIDRVNTEMIALGENLLEVDGLPAILEVLRTKPELYFGNKKQILEAATKALDAARTAMPRYFGITPKTDVGVVAIPDYEAPFTTIAYYRPPHYDGSKAGEYFINTYEPRTRPRFELQVLTYHESIPGHHLQYTISQERNELPAFRKFGGNTAFSEGWALYTERLAEEMGLYSGDLDRMGMLSYDAWRAARLVVDTGIHAFGWTRQQAIDYMLAHTALAENNIVNEVDRYVSWPGQALAYKVGQLEMIRLRQWAEDELGQAFALPAFHDVVLRNGAVTLPVLEKEVKEWVKASR
jgi:uncharacterized protein (DUF885 family)